MLPRQIYTILLAFLLQPVASLQPQQQESFLSENLVTKDQIQSVLQHEPVKVPTCEQIPTGPIETTLCDFETVEGYNDELYSNLHELVETPFFKYFRVDLYRECPFWQENGFCKNEECGITTVDESEIPARWRAAELSKLELSPEDLRQEVPGSYYRDTDFCFIDDMSEGDYVDLTANPERFTGYAGPSANRVWASIYEENCFGLSERNLLSSGSLLPDPQTLPNSQLGVFRTEGAETAKTCMEKRVYYKIISGLHASISTHICHEDMNQTTGQWGPNLKCFVNRIASHPERLKYIYFDVVLLLRAVARIGPYLNNYNYHGSGTHEPSEEHIHDKIARLVNIAQTVGQFDEKLLFQGEDANILKEEFKHHFRNVTRIMDCVGCDKCRLWGKVQTTGVGTALKILFEMDEKALDPRLNANLLAHSEVVALINTLHRFTESLSFVNDFRKMWAEASEQEGRSLIHEATEGSSSPTSSSHKPKHSPLATHDTVILPRPRFFIDIQRWYCACRDGTLECVRGVLMAIKDALTSIANIFQLSGKERGPHSEF